MYMAKIIVEKYSGNTTVYYLWDEQSAKEKLNFLKKRQYKRRNSYKNVALQEVRWL